MGPTILFVMKKFQKSLVDLMTGQVNMCVYTEFDCLCYLTYTHISLSMYYSIFFQPKNHKNTNRADVNLDVSNLTTKYK